MKKLSNAQAKVMEQDENGNIVYYHKCTRFKKKK